MTRRSKIRTGAAALFSLVNLAGAVMATAQREFLHAGTHVALFLLGAYVVRRVWRPSVTMVPAERVPRELDDCLTHLELSIEAVALGVERIGEGQRFITSFLTLNATPTTAGENEQRHTLE